MEGLRIILIAALFTASVDGACKTKDASWNRGIKPRISQPQRNDPDKVVIDWSRSIKNARCVDSYNVRILFCFAFPDALINFSTCRFTFGKLDNPKREASVYPLPTKR